ncbi:MAG: TonB-dependent receptor [Pseudomonadota bacterium]
MKNGTLLAGAAVMALSAFSAPSAAAQEASEDAELKQDVVLVKARKVEEDIQTVPVAVTVFDSEALFERGIADIDELSKLTPGFIFDTPFGRQFDRPIIRGQANILGDSGVSVFIDGVNVTQSIRSLNFGDVQSIEIIKGPQSALFGRNTYSGAINITSKQPTNEVEGDIRVEVGSEGLGQFTGSVSGPIIDDKLFYSLSGRYYTFDSEFDVNSNLNPSVGNEESKTVSGVLRYEPTDQWDMTLRVAYNADDDGHFPIGLLGFDDLNVNVPGGFQAGGTQPFFRGEVPTQAPNPSGSSQLSDTLGEGGGLEREEFFMAANSNFEFGGGYNLFTTLGYTREIFRDELDSDGQPGSFATAHIFGPFPLGPPGSPFGVGLIPFDFTTTDDDEQETFVAEARIDSPQDRRLRWRLGGYYFNNVDFQDDLAQRFADPRFEQAALDSFNSGLAEVAAALGQPFVVAVQPFEYGPSNPSTTRIENVSVFGSVGYDFTDRVTGTVELRWANESINQRVFDTDTGDLLTLADGSDFDVEEEFDAVTPRFTLDYQVTDDNLLYASVANGTKPGGFNGEQGFEFGFGVFDEEESWQYEIGSKNYLFDNQLLLNGAAYFTELEGYQLTENLAALGANSTTGSVTANLGEVEIFGIELESAYSPAAIEGLTVGGTYAWTDAEFTEGQEATQGAVFGDSDLTGQTIPRQAEHQASFFLDYETELQENFDALFSLSGNYLSSRFAQVQNLAETGDSFELDARVTFTLTDRISLAVYGKNLTDEDAPLGVLRFIDALGVNSYTLAGQPIPSVFELASSGQSRGFQYNNRHGTRWGAILRYQF